MCISILSTAHPDYPFILLNNRDEFLNRPTARAAFWDPHNSHILGGRDLHREERGTWLGITKQGRLANLTNFREEGVEISKDKSRGGIPKSYLTESQDSVDGYEQYVDHLINETGIHDVGGFTLLFGKLRAAKDGKFPGLAIISNRTSSAISLQRICTTTGETHGLSNSHFGDLTWPKVVRGEQLLRQAIISNVSRKAAQAQFIESLFAILSVSVIPPKGEDEDWMTYVRQMRNSIMIPPVGGEAIERSSTDGLRAAEGGSTPSHGEVRVGEGVYGTQKQTVVLVDREGGVTYVERTLFDAQGKPTEGGERDQRVTFQIEGWND